MTLHDAGFSPRGSADATAFGDGEADVDLILRTRSGDRAAFAELWRRHYRSGLTVARSVTSNLDPDDLVQEAYTRIYQSIVAGGGPTGSFRAYLFTCIRNTAAAWGRARREMTIDALETVEDPATTDQATADALDRSLTHQAFRSLPTRWQEVLWYSEIEQMKPAEIAPLLGMKATAVAQLTFRAREGLREAWIQAHLRSVADDSDCQWTIEHLGAYSRANISRRDGVKVNTHLGECARCAIVASEAKEVSRRLALVLVPLTVGSVGAAGYLASLHGGALPAMALAAMPSTVMQGAVTVAPALPTATFAVGSAGAGAGTWGAGTVGAGTLSAAGSGSVAAAGAAAATSATTAGVAVGGAAGAAGSAAVGSASIGAAAASAAAAGSVGTAMATAGAVGAATGTAAVAATGLATAGVAAGGVLSGFGAVASLAATGFVVAGSLMVGGAGSMLASASFEQAAATSIVQQTAIPTTGAPLALPSADVQPPGLLLPGTPVTLAVLVTEPVVLPPAPPVLVDQPASVAPVATEAVVAPAAPTPPMTPGVPAEPGAAVPAPDTGTPALTDWDPEMNGPDASDPVAPDDTASADEEDPSTDQVTPAPTEPVVPASGETSEPAVPASDETIEAAAPIDTAPLQTGPCAAEPAATAEPASDVATTD
ncbi:RNA polymerase sigma factor [Microbacterium pumilum]|uniref:Sigma-70 family RNA polymerase sigma factor n=1 Tax=Microbacterium pumilum TaxID=344165 RepID=A0ABP5DTV0_9MICO